jgi:chorismate mutase
MTEPVMYFGIGFVVAASLGLLIVLRVYRALSVGSPDQLHADVRQLEGQLAVALRERSKLQTEIASIKHDAETIWAAERVESALFRERINDVAYEVVRITQVIEGSALSIEPTPAYAARMIEHGSRTEALNINSASDEASAPMMHTSALADRIRALRTTASRVAAS